MKRALSALLCGILLVAGYFGVIVILYRVFQLRFETVAVLLKPLNLPYDIYKMIFGFYYGDRTVVMVLNQLANVFLYSFVFYLIFTIYARIKREKKINGIETPPEPPAFL